MSSYRSNKLMLRAVETVAGVLRPVLNRIAMQQARDIALEQQRRALASTADFVQQHMGRAQAEASKLDLLTRAFQQADTSGERLICEFGVFQGTTINHIAGLTTNTVFGFDSFEGLPEDWKSGIKKGHFAVEELPAVRSHVKLIKGWFHESIPPFLAQQRGKVAFLHVDCDLYSSTKIVFELLAPRLAAGSVIVFDEYFNFPGWEEGEHKAFTEFIAKTGLGFEFIGYHAKDEQVALVLK